MVTVAFKNTLCPRNVFSTIMKYNTLYFSGVHYRDRLTVLWLTYCTVCGIHVTQTEEVFWNLSSVLCDSWDVLCWPVNTEGDLIRSNYTSYELICSVPRWRIICQRQRSLTEITKNKKGYISTFDHTIYKHYIMTLYTRTSFRWRPTSHHKERVPYWHRTTHTAGLK